MSSSSSWVLIFRLSSNKVEQNSYQYCSWNIKLDQLIPWFYLWFSWFWYPPLSLPNEEATRVSASPAILIRHVSSMGYNDGSSLHDESQSEGLGGRGPWGWIESADESLTMEDFLSFGYCSKMSSGCWNECEPRCWTSNLPSTELSSALLPLDT